MHTLLQPCETGVPCRQREGGRHWEWEGKVRLQRTMEWCKLRKLCRGTKPVRDNFNFFFFSVLFYCWSFLNLEACNTVLWQKKGESVLGPNSGLSDVGPGEEGVLQLVFPSDFPLFPHINHCHWIPENRNNSQGWAEPLNWSSRLTQSPLHFKRKGMLQSDSLNLSIVQWCW